MGVSCLFVRDASSRAVKSPRIVTVSAASLEDVAIVIMGVLRGVILLVRISPATILPPANRLIGLITAGLFSLIGDRALNRGIFISTA